MSRHVIARVPRVSNGTGCLGARRGGGQAAPVALGVWARGRRRPAGSATGWVVVSWSAWRVCVVWAHGAGRQQGVPPGEWPPLT